MKARTSGAAKATPTQVGCEPSGWRSGAWGWLGMADVGGRALTALRRRAEHDSRCSAGALGACATPWDDLSRHPPPRTHCNDQSQAAKPDTSASGTSPDPASSGGSAAAATAASLDAGVLLDVTAQIAQGSKARDDHEQDQAGQGHEPSAKRQRVAKPPLPPRSTRATRAKQGSGGSAAGLKEEPAGQGDTVELKQEDQVADGGGSGGGAGATAPDLAGSCGGTSK